MPKIKPLYRDKLKDRIKGEVAVHGLTQEQMADKMGISRSKWQHMMYGRTTDWRIGDTVKACKVLDIPVSELGGLIA